MIFVTVGTHEQPFNRLVECIDGLKRDGIIEEDVFIQTGYCTYEPQYCKWQKLFSYQEMLQLVKEARIVITHGGPSSFIMPLQIGKTPVVVPRIREFNEHLHNQQDSLSKNGAKQMGTIIVIDNIDKLGMTIKNYEKIVTGMKSGLKSNNSLFNEELEKIVDGMFKEK